MKKPRVVIDTNVVVSALRSRRGASHKLLLLIDSGKFATCLSVPVLLEYEEVCKRLVGQISLTTSDVDDVLDYLCKQAEPVSIYYLWRPWLKDPKDDMLLELAVAGGCDYIVTYNTTDFQGVEQFGIGLRTAKELLQEIGELP
jgi:putative PIN family toxin of toxin-antitoxin system